MDVQAGETARCASVPERSLQATVNDETVRFLRRRLRAMLPGAAFNAKMIAENIAFGAAVLGAGHVELVERDGWWFVASNFNWLAAGLAPFEGIQPFPEQSSSSHRAEIYVTAFADHAYLRFGEAVCWLRGKPLQPLPDEGVTPPWCGNVVAFRLPRAHGGLNGR